MRIILVGYGKMGRMIEQIACESGDEIVAVFDEISLKEFSQQEKADVVMDFSRPEALNEICAYVRRTGTALVSGTTGYDAAQREKLLSLGSCAPVMWSANYSIGIAVFVRALAQISDVLKPGFDIEIEETHHNQKADAPSGTAKLLLEAIDPAHELTPVYGREGSCGKRKKTEVGMHALRGGTVAGTHTVHFFGTDEELEITHRAASRRIFADGALQMARRIAGQPAGVYRLQELLFED